jgi:hypothetical protein
MLAALEKLDIRAELEDVRFDEKTCHFKEQWKILGKNITEKGGLLPKMLFLNGFVNLVDLASFRWL